MEENYFIGLMAVAITATDGSESESLTAFEQRLLELKDHQLIWDLFRSVRVTLMRRLYGMAIHQLDHPSEAQPNGHTPPSGHPRTASEPEETVDSSLRRSQPIHTGSQHSTVSTANQNRVTRFTRSRSPRNARSAQNVLINIGERKSKLDLIHNQHGKPIGDLTYMGLANAYDESPTFQRYAQRLMDSGIPKTGREGDIVRRFITPDEADRMWLDLFKEPEQAA